MSSYMSIVKCIIMKVCITCMTSPVSGGHPFGDYLNKEINKYNSFFFFLFKNVSFKIKSSEKQEHKLTGNG